MKRIRPGDKTNQLRGASYDLLERLRRKLRPSPAERRFWRHWQFAAKF